MPERVVVRLRVNGQDLEAMAEPRTLLVDFLRDELGLTGTHAGCEHGVCGACTIVLDGATVRSCLIFATQANGRELWTVEGLASAGQLSPLQQAFHEMHGLQCGYCTPGMLMTALELLHSSVEPDAGDIREAIAGNLCRCTGYQNIIRAIRAAAQSYRQGAVEPAMGRIWPGESTNG